MVFACCIVGNLVVPMVCTHMCIDVRLDVRLETRIDMCLDMVARFAESMVYRLVCGHV